MVTTDQLHNDSIVPLRRGKCAVIELHTHRHTHTHTQYREKFWSLRDGEESPIINNNKEKKKSWQTAPTSIILSGTTTKITKLKTILTTPSFCFGHRYYLQYVY